MKRYTFSVDTTERRRPRYIRMCTMCRFLTNSHPEDEATCPNDGAELVLDPDAPQPTTVGKE